MTAASIANFNIDFLSVSCVFLEVTWAISLSVPFLFMFAFVLLYILAEIRSFIAWRVGRFIKFKYIPPKLEDDNEDEEEEEVEVETKDKPRFKYTPKALWRKFYLFILNSLIWTYNVLLWLVREGSTRQDLKRFINKCINAYCAFLSFSFM